MTDRNPVLPAPSMAALNLTPDPAADVYHRLLRERIVFLGTQVDQNSANQICAQLLLLEAEDPERDISLYINSPGGSVTDGLAIYDTMQYVRCDVATICLGLAASMGQFLLCAGTPGKRYALAALAHPHAPALGPDAGPGGGHRHPGRADRLSEADDGRADRLPHRSDRSSGSRRTPTVTAGSPPRKRATTASSTRSSTGRTAPRR